MALPFKILEAHHTGLTVRDLDSSLAFWQGALGFELLYRARRFGTFAAEVTGVPGADIEIAVLQAPGHRIELLHYLAPADRGHVAPRACDIGSLHLAFDVDDLDVALAHVAAHDWRVSGTPQTIDSGSRKGTRVVLSAIPTGPRSS